MPPNQPPFSWAVLIAIVATWTILVPESALPFQGSKALVLPLTAMLALAEKRRRPLVAGSWGFAVLLWFFAVLALSTLLSPAPRVAFWGNDHRQMGALVWGGALALTWVWTRTRRSPRALGLSLVTGSGVAVAVLFWARGLPPAGSLASLLPGLQAGGTLGNAAFLATALVPLVPLFLGLAFQAWKDDERRLAGVFMVALGWTVAGLGLTGSRAGLLGLWVAALVLGVLWLPRPWRWLWAGVGTLAPVGLILWAATHPNTPAWDFLHRNATLAQRLIVWRATLELLYRHPFRALVGFGADTMGLFFPEVYPSVLIGYEPDLQPHVFDRAHNLLLDIWIQFGLIGVVGTALSAGWLVRTWRGTRNASGSTIYQDAAFAAFCALCGTWIVHFPIPPTLLLAGLLAVEATRPPSREDGYDVLPVVWGTALGWVTIFALSGGPRARALITGIALVGGILSITVSGTTPSLIERLLLPAVLAGAALLILPSWAGLSSMVALALVIGTWMWHTRAQASSRWVLALVGLALVFPPWVSDAWLGAGERALSRGDVVAAIRLGHRAWRLFPQERTALFNARAHFVYTKDDLSGRLRTAEEWLARSPTPHSADWWYVRLRILQRGYEDGVVPKNVLDEARAKARSYFPGNLVWP